LNQVNGILPLNDSHLYSALIARDARFDGVFFVGVTTTGVYCRPVCRAPKPRSDRCRYFTSAAAAERRGFRPCLRCRPELAPGIASDAGEGGCGSVASVDAVGRLARVAAQRIAAGALDESGVDQLATELNVSARHLRRAIERELGATPVELATTRRLLTAKQLLSDTELPITRVAFASGFRSLRRFNSLFRSRYRLAPSSLRLRARTHAGGGTAGALPDTISLTLAYRPPLDWGAMCTYLLKRATPGVEAVTSDRGGRYWRSVQIQRHSGLIAVSPAPDSPARASNVHNDALRLDVSVSLLPVLVPLLARLRQLFDLDADPESIAAHLGGDPVLSPLVARHPGLRVPGAIDGFDLAIRAVLGQQVTVQCGSTLAGRLAQLVAEPLTDAPAFARGHAIPVRYLPVTAERVADAGESAIAAIGLPRSRAACVVRLARAVADGEVPELTSDAAGGDPATFVGRLTALPGIGGWTAAYIAMRALHWPDAFPESDLGLRKAMGGLSPSRLRAAAEAWRPWRAYAAQHLWAVLGDSRG
jgi:AraC family transcriptional regulator of adaptative response / DNA-3-methyladenine glycosylase II